MDATYLAQQLQTALGLTSVTEELTGYATGYVTALKTGLASHSSGTVVGTAPPGGPLVGGAATAGQISGVIPTVMTGIMSATGGFHFANQAMISSENSATLGYVESAGIIDFESGSVNGTCTATILSPGILANGTGTDGEISLLVGSALASLIKPIVSPTQSAPLMVPFYTALCNYTMDYLRVNFSTGTVTGNFAPGGGALTGGAASGGVVT